MNAPDDDRASLSASPEDAPLRTRELLIVDDDGLPRLVLTTTSGTPAIRLLRADGETGLALALDPEGTPSAKLTNPRGTGPTATLEIDLKGAHVRFDHPEGASAYLFLSNAGASGVVLNDRGGVRRMSATVAPDGTPKIATFDDETASPT